MLVRGDDTLVYDTIPADRFYQAGLDAIAGNPALRLHQGVSVLGCDEDAGGAVVTTAQGILRAQLVIDTRPPLPTAGAGGLLQSFSGLEVETAEPRFNPSTVGLMAFEAAAAEAITFLYTLPFSPTRALLELTHMSPLDRAPPPMQTVRALLADRLGCEFKVVREESGALPMRPLVARPTRPGRLLRLGSSAGALRSSTGYGFANIQTQTDALAGALRGGAEAALGWRPPMLPAWMRLMDRLFLRVLHRHPEAGPAILTALFRGCPSPALVRFLSGTGGLMDGGRVVLSMPKAPFIRDLAWLG